MPTASPSPERGIRPGPRFTVASWVILLVGLLLTFAMYQWAVTHRRPGEWLPGIAQAVIGIAGTALGSAACGLAALLRRERHCWLAWLPFLAGVGTIFYFLWNRISH